MVKHIILWQLKEELDAAQKAEIPAQKSKRDWRDLRDRFRDSLRFMYRRRSCRLPMRILCWTAALKMRLL